MHWPTNSMSKGTHSTKEDIKPNDIVVLVIGPTGAGKSTFINSFLREQAKQRMKVGHGLTSCTKDIQAAHIDLSGRDAGNRLVIVDTPGFDDANGNDSEILRRIAVWLKECYRQHKNDQQNVVLGGVIYLHDISNDRFSGTARKNLAMFRGLCKEASPNKTVLGTTKWGRDLDIAAAHEKELKNVHWKALIEKGSIVRRFMDDSDSAMSFIEVILQDVKWGILMDTFSQIQEALAVPRNIIPETQAGEEMRCTYQEVLEILQTPKSSRADDARLRHSPHKLDDVQGKIEKLMAQLKELRVPLGQRLKRLWQYFTSPARNPTQLDPAALTSKPTHSVTAILTPARRYSSASPSIVVEPSSRRTSLSRIGRDSKFDDGLMPSGLRKSPVSAEAFVSSTSFSDTLPIASPNSTETSTLEETSPSTPRTSLYGSEESVTTVPDLSPESTLANLTSTAAAVQQLRAQTTASISTTISSLNVLRSQAASNSAAFDSRIVALEDNFRQMEEALRALTHQGSGPTR